MKKSIFFMLLSIPLLISACSTKFPSLDHHEPQDPNIVLMEQPLSNIQEKAIVNSPSVLSKNSYTTSIDSVIYINTGESICTYDYISNETDSILYQENISGLGNIGYVLFFLQGQILNDNTFISNKLCTLDLNTNTVSTVLELTPNIYQLQSHENLLLLSCDDSYSAYTLDDDSKLVQTEVPFTVEFKNTSLTTNNYSAIITENDQHLSITTSTGNIITLNEAEHKYGILDGSEDYLVFFDMSPSNNTSKYVVNLYYASSETIEPLYAYLPWHVELQNKWILTIPAPNQDYQFHYIITGDAYTPICYIQNILESKKDSIETFNLLMTDGITPEGKIVELDKKSIAVLIENFKNQPLLRKKVNKWSPDYYILVRDKNHKPVMLLEFWNNYVCVNHSEYYEVVGNSNISLLDKIFHTSTLVPQMTPEEILLSYMEDNHLPLYQENIFLYGDNPALIVETGVGSLSNYQGEYYYEKILECDGKYFDYEFGTTYLLSLNTVYYNADGTVLDGIYDRHRYYDYLTGENVPFPY